MSLRSLPLLFACFLPAVHAASCDVLGGGAGHVSDLNPDSLGGYVTVRT